MNANTKNMMRRNRFGSHSATGAMRQTVALALGLASAAAMAACGDTGGGARQTGPRVERPAFQADRAFAHVRTQLSFGPRVPGSEGHSRQLSWMIESLATRGAQVVIDRFDYTTSGGEVLPLTNVLARFNPEAERRLLLLTHWDTRPTSDQAPDPSDYDTPVPGANDGASGTAVLLELSALFHEQAPTVGVDLLFVDGEDYGPETVDMFIGSNRFAETQSKDWAYAVLIDMVGDADPEFPIEGYSAEYAPAIAQRVWAIAGELGYARYFPERVGPRVLDDHVPLNEAGIQTIDIIDFVYGPDTKPGGQYWHTPLDTIDNVSAFTLGMVGEVLAEVVYRGG